MVVSVTVGAVTDTSSPGPLLHTVPGAQFVKGLAINHSCYTGEAAV